MCPSDCMHCPSALHSGPGGEHPAATTTWQHSTFSSRPGSHCPLWIHAFMPVTRAARAWSLHRLVALLSTTEWQLIIVMAWRPALVPSVCGAVAWTGSCLIVPHWVCTLGLPTMGAVSVCVLSEHAQGVDCVTSLTAADTLPAGVVHGPIQHES